MTDENESDKRGAEPHRRAELKLILKDTAPPIMVIVVSILVWEMAVVVFHVPKYVIARPSQIFLAFVDKWPELVVHANQTLYEALVGFFIASLIAYSLAAFMGIFQVVGRSIYPLIIAFRSIPIVAIAPLLFLWLGFSIWPIIVTVVAICFFPVVVNGVTGIRSVEQEIIELMRILDASKWKTFKYVQFYTMLPYLFSGMKISAVLAVMGAVVAEWVGSTAGLGYLILIAGRYSDVVLLFEALTLLSLMGLGLFGFIVFVEYRLLRWRTSR